MAWSFLCPLLLCQVVSHNFDTLLVVEKGALWLSLLEEGRDFKIGVVIMWVQLADLPEQLKCFLLVGGCARLAGFDLGQQSDGFIAVLEPSA